MTPIAVFHSHRLPPPLPGATEIKVPRWPACPIPKALEHPPASLEATGLLLPVRAVAAIFLPATNLILIASKFANSLTFRWRPVKDQAHDEAMCLLAGDQLADADWQLVQLSTRLCSAIPTRLDCK